MINSRLIAQVLIMVGLSVHAQGQRFHGREELVFFTDSRIEHDSTSYQSYTIKNGEFTVFELVTDNSGEPGNNSKAESLIAFQIKNGSNEFVLKDEELLKHRAIYIQRCRCQDRGIQLIQTGELHGKMLPNGNWKIKGEVKAIGKRSGKTYDLPIVGEFKSAEG